MKTKTFRLVSISTLIALMLSVIPAPAFAASITSVTPAQIVNDVPTTITINGSGFTVGSAVVLLNGSALSTTVVNDAVMTATVPAGLGAGFYTVAVSNGVDPDASCVNCLQILAPTPIPPPPTATATTAPLPFVRPQLVVNSTTTKGSVQTNGEFKLNVNLDNAGSSTAYSVQAVLSSSDLVPLKNGGVSALGAMNPGENVGLAQNFLVTGQIWGQRIVVVDLTLTYYDDQGVAYSDKFTLSITASGGVSSGVAAATATPTGVKSSQLVITGYSTDVDPLQPGEKFTLKLAIQNVGNAKAQRITMIVGGGSGGTSGGTPQPGGVSGGSGDFANFAPVGASNVQSLGELNPGAGIEASQNLVVNVSTNPGAYPMTITFSYLNDKNEVINDEQVITLLVYSLPNLDISFYQPPGEFFTGQPGALPIQIVNVGKRLAVLGNVRVESEAGFVESGTGLVGSLDVGGFFTIDSLFTPDQPGAGKVNITIDYLDDFNQPRTFTKTLEVEVIEQVIEETPETPGGGVIEPEAETFWQKVWRFILGILGLDSSRPSDPEAVPVEGGVIEEVAPVNSGGKGGP
ncbi:MAG: IPT/TIG domain-containing protein [Anaerolineales bacterium]|nr:MAG: IPT/TIG domain-containing protein [Anaerolineales bacterium]